MTSLTGTELPPGELAPADLVGASVQSAVREYLANPLFRAARYEELVLDDNPYRRPVRPDDIDMVDFGTPLNRENFAQLSGLMGNRMLLNIHDVDKFLLTCHPTPEKWQNYQDFYAPRSRYLGDLIRPHLDAHLFEFVRDGARERHEPTVGAAKARVRELVSARCHGADDLRHVIVGSGASQEMLSMLAIQAGATMINIRGLAIGQRLLDRCGMPGVAGTLDGSMAPSLLLRRTTEHIGIKQQLHNYYQYYLPSTLALMNYVNSAARDPGQVFALVGALVGQFLEYRTVGAVFESILGDQITGTTDRESPEEQDQTLGCAVEQVENLGGEFGLGEFARGLEEYSVLLDAHHEDRMRQFTWISEMPECVVKALRLYTAIREHGVEVEMDTFVESSEECSTTHVHDDDRLLVIESGEMDFWNCFGARHTLRPGDMTFVPKHRLHGSVVLSGECVYHQPVITREIDEQFGGGPHPVRRR